MPITEELKTAQELRDAGLPQRVAEVLAAKFEVTALATRDAAFNAFRTEMNARFDALSLRLAELQAEISGTKAEIGNSKADTEKSMRSLQGTILTAVLGAASLIIALLIGLKMF
jgi:peptidoglycan hydrolase CwlO-like protein